MLLSMLQLGIAALAIAAPAMGGGFTFAIGSPVASQDFHFKAAVFVFRTEGCSEGAKAQVSATAEGIVKGERRSIVLNVLPGNKPGVFGIYQSWPAEGQWLVDLRGTCADLSAGAIVPIGPKGFVREASKFFSRPATDSEIDASLKGLSKGGNK
ncbi:MAG TPA: hypothetical protein VMR62_05160 [Bryobacteraceae bacterium]|jgi:hypothetical protein|nr:hypothetical protein [Bryobacteraceae bacterium]